MTVDLVTARPDTDAMEAMQLMKKNRLRRLVLVDKAGNISKVFPPGIQSMETITAALDGLK